MEYLFHFSYGCFKKVNQNLGFLTFRADALKLGPRFCPVVTKPAGCTGAYGEDFFLLRNPYTIGSF